MNFSYYVLKGETLSDLSKRYNTSEEEILKANPGLKKDNLIVGQLINIPLHQEFVHKINQIYYTNTTSKYELKKMLNLLFNKHYLYTHLLIVDARTNVINNNHIEIFLSFAKQLQIIINETLKINIDIKTPLTTYLLTLSELIRVYPKNDNQFNKCLIMANDLALCLTSLNLAYNLDDIKLTLRSYQELIIKQIDAIIDQDYETYDLLYDKVEDKCNKLVELIISLYKE
jgi:hypothetical protein